MHTLKCFVAVVEPPAVTLSESGPRVAEATYALTCTVTLPSGVQLNDSVPPTIQWPELNTTIPRILQNRNGTYVRILTLNPLHERHSGQYSCSASYSLGGISSEVVTDEMNVTVISEFIMSCL